PTIASDTATASRTGRPATYTSTGTVMMEPPPPTSPSDNPMPPLSSSAQYIPAVHMPYSLLRYPQDARCRTPDAKRIAIPGNPGQCPRACAIEYSARLEDVQGTRRHSMRL